MTALSAEGFDVKYAPALSIADGEVRHRRPLLDDDPHGFVAEDVAGVEERSQRLVEVEIGSAQARRGHLDDDVGVLLDRGVGDVLDAHVAPALPGECLHGVLQ